MIFHFQHHRIARERETHAGLFRLRMTRHVVQGFLKYAVDLNGYALVDGAALTGLFVCHLDTSALLEGGQIGVESAIEARFV